MNPETLLTADPSSPAPHDWGGGASSLTPPLSEGEAGWGSGASTGPRTDDGKRVAARNATTHGLFARDVVLPHLGEDPRGYEALLSALAGQLQPKNMLEQHYVEKIAAASWRLRRLQRWQAQLFEDPDITEDEALAKLDRVMRHETNLHRQIDTSIRMLARDIPKLFQERVRAELIRGMNATEKDCQEEPLMNEWIISETRRRIPSEPIPESLKDAPLDAAPAPPCQSVENCQNEPASLVPPELGARGRSSSTPLPKIKSAPALPPRLTWEGTPTNKNCQNEPHAGQQKTQRFAFTSGSPRIGG